jgi:hypothetical protein
MTEWRDIVKIVVDQMKLIRKDDKCYNNPQTEVV